ncbi:hypothetical protein Tco_0548896 [Tanacetum coccineum]
MCSRSVILKRAREILRLFPLAFLSLEICAPCLLEFCFLDVNVLLDNHDDLFRVLRFCLPCIQYGREKVHLDDSRFPQFAPRDVPDLSYESFLLSQSLESERVGEAIGTTPNEFEELEYVFPGEVGTYSGEAEIKSGKLEEKASSIPEIRWLGENIVLLTTQ